VGLVTPHILRILRSSDYAFLLLGSAPLGAIPMEAADVAARIVIPAAELPIGIIAAIIGAPCFLPFCSGSEGCVGWAGMTMLHLVSRRRKVDSRRDQPGLSTEPLQRAAGAEQRLRDR
jgi:hypothetical protein